MPGVRLFILSVPHITTQFTSLRLHLRWHSDYIGRGLRPSCEATKWGDDILRSSAPTSSLFPLSGRPYLWATGADVLCVLLRIGFNLYLLTRRTAARAAGGSDPDKLAPMHPTPHHLFNVNVLRGESYLDYLHGGGESAPVAGA